MTNEFVRGRTGVAPGNSALRSHAAATGTRARPLLASAAILVGVAAGQGTGGSPSEIIRALIGPSHPGEGEEIVVSTCGETEEFRRERAEVRDLVSLGRASVSDLEHALDSIEAEAERSPFYAKVGWLLVAYAKTQGAEALPRLRKMARVARLRPLAINLDRAIAFYPSI